MKLSKTIDQTRICKKSYDDPLGYFCMGFFFFTCPVGQVTNKFYLSNGLFHLSRTIGQTLLSRPVYMQILKSKNIKAQPMCKFAQLYACHELFRF
jgi:hypothetical protein